MSNSAYNRAMPIDFPYVRGLNSIYMSMEFVINTKEPKQYENNIVIQRHVGDICSIS
jgi:hypothetical protein